MGEAPNSVRKTRRSCRSVTLSRSANPESFNPSRMPSSMRVAARQASLAPASMLELPGASSGRHLRHGLKPACFGCRRALKKRATLTPRRFHGANGPAVDARRHHPGKESAVRTAHHGLGGPDSICRDQVSLVKYNGLRSRILAVFGHGSKKIGRGWGNGCWIPSHPRDKRS